MQQQIYTLQQTSRCYFHIYIHRTQLSFIIYKHCHLNQQLVIDFSHNLIPTLVKYALRFALVVPPNQLHQQLELIVIAMATFPVTILENPRQQFRLFNRAAVAAYGAACTTIHQHGLLGYIVNDTQWGLLPGNNITDPDPEVADVILPRPTVVIPLTPAPTAGALTIKVWERKLADNIAVTDNLKTQAHIQHAIDTYLVAHPLVGEQTFLALTTHVVEQAPNFAPTIASMGYAANSMSVTHDHLPSDPSLTILSPPAFSALLTAAVKAAHTPARKNAPLSALLLPDRIASITAMMGIPVRIAVTCWRTLSPLINVPR